jgi:hypothetical protein
MGTVGAWSSCWLSLSRPVRRLTRVDGRSRPARAGIFARSPNPTTRPHTRGAIGWSDSVQGLKQPGRDESGRELAEGGHEQRQIHMESIEMNEEARDQDGQRGGATKQHAPESVYRS